MVCFAVWAPSPEHCRFSLTNMGKAGWESHQSLVAVRRVLQLCRVQEHLEHLGGSERRHPRVTVPWHSSECCSGVFTDTMGLCCGAVAWGWVRGREGAGDSPGLTDASLLILFCQLLCVPRHVQWIQHQPQRPLPSCAAASPWHSFKAPSPRLCPVQPTPPPVAAGECQGRVCVWCETCWACLAWEWMMNCLFYFA